MKLKNITIISMILFNISGCFPAIIAGGGKIVSTVAVSEKSVGNAIDDSTIWSRIRIAFIRSDIPATTTNNISVKVLEGKILLTGEITSVEDKMRIIKIVWSQKGVKQVNDEIEIVSKNEINVKNLIKDTWITSQLKSKMLLKKNIKSVNYTIETIKGTVYLFGIAQDNNELDEITNIARKINGVVKVLSFVRLKDDDMKEDLETNDHKDDSHQIKEYDPNEQY
jgi:osmotically-inducible protein OsmY